MCNAGLCGPETAQSARQPEAAQIRSYSASRRRRGGALYGPTNLRRRPSLIAARGSNAARVQRLRESAERICSGLTGRVDERPYVSSLFVRPPGVRRACQTRGRRVAAAFAAASAALVRAEIISRSWSATAARMWMMIRVAVGLSQATNSILLSIRFAMKATLRVRRSSLAITRTPRLTRQGRDAAGNCRRPARSPDATS